MNQLDREELICKAVVKLLPQQTFEEWVEEGKQLADELQKNHPVVDGFEGWGE